jgi:hypothetical protein
MLGSELGPFRIVLVFQLAVGRSEKEAYTSLVCSIGKLAVAKSELQRSDEEARNMT